MYSKTRRAVDLPSPLARERWRTEYAGVKATRRMLVDALPNAHKQDIIRFHTDVWLGGGVFHKALGSKQVCDQLAILVR